MITTFYPPYNFGGDGIIVHRLSNELARRGHKVDVIHCIDTYRFLAHQEPTTTYDDHPNVTVHGLESKFGFLSPLVTHQTGLPFFKSARIRQILKTGFDVIHYHNISLVGGPKILEYGEGIKLYTMHDYWLICPTHVMFRFNRAPCTNPYCFLCCLTYRRPPQLWRYLNLLEKALKHVDVFISPNNFIKDLPLQMGLNIPVVNLSHFVPSLMAAKSTSEGVIYEVSKTPYYLFVGRLERLKGLQTLIPIFRNYSKAQLLIAGIGSYEPRLRQLAGNSVNIRFLGYQSSSDLQALYRQAVAVIVPSLCFEVFPLVVIEAFSQQTPTIVRNIGGLSTTIEEYGGGLVYNTEEELVTAMDKFLTDPLYRCELGFHAYKTFQRKWSAETHIKRYFELIQERAKVRGKKIN
ncbi:glycosyltransferase family 4 protein [Candidatus Latescibacterota bacterium]